MFCVLAPFDVLVRAARLCWALGLPLPEEDAKAFVLQHHYSAS
ncbi:hypothetical protein [Streptomyces sp. NPDC001410]